MFPGLDSHVYLLTFGTYGSRLHGDIRGTVDRMHNGRGEPHLARDDWRRAYETRLMRGAPFQITPAQRAALDVAFREVAVFREWTTLAGNIRNEHVHLVVAGEASGGAMMGTFKAYGTRRLRDLGLISADELVWAKRGSARALRSDESVAVAIDYVANRQGALLPGSGRLHQCGRDSAGDDQG